MECLFRGGSEGQIRQQLIEENLLDAVIGLPANLFYGTGIPAAILLFKRHKTDRKVLFIDASQEFEAGTNQNRLRRQDLDKILTTVRARHNVDKYTCLASLDEIAQHDYNLNILRYVDTFEEEAPVDLRAVQLEISRVEKGLTEVMSRMAVFLGELGI